MIFIIGAGLSGLAIANELINSGKKVRIYNYEEKGESSLAAVGMLAPLFESKPYEEKLFLAMIESKKKWTNFAKNLLKTSGINIELKNNSSLMIANDINDLERLDFKKKFFKRLGYNVDIMNSPETRKLEPNLSPNVVGSIFCKGQDQVNPILLKKSLKTAFLKMGGEFVNKKIEKIFFEDTQVGIYLDGEKKICSNIIISSGAWSRNLLKNSFNFEIPLTPLKGVTLTVKNHLKKKIHHNLWFRKIYVAPRSNGDLVIGATEEDKGFDTKINLSDVYFLSKNIVECLPFIEDLEIMDFKSGLRPGTYDGFPIIGKIDSISKQIICAFGHYRHGVLLLPFTAKLVCDLVDGQENEQIFSPERFS